MCDIFTKKDMQKLLGKKYIMLIGSSNTRALYKDFVWLWTNNTLISQQALKKKLEPSFLGDSLLKGERLVRGRNYEEVREFKKPDIRIGFEFITRCYTDSIESLMTDIKKGCREAPDVLVYNSCLWDLTRWGPNGVQTYKDNLIRLMKLFKRCLPAKTIVMWVATEAVSQDCRGGLFVKQVEFMKHYLRFEVMEANMLARQIVVSHGFDFLDIHYYLRMQIHRRAGDGVHWTPVPVRHVTNLILTHVALSWKCDLPGHFGGTMLEKAKNLLTKVEHKKVCLPKLPPHLNKERPTISKSLLGSPVTGSPFRVAMKRKLQNFLSSSKEDKENLPASRKMPLLDTPKRNVDQHTSNLRKPFSNVIRTVNIRQPRTMHGFGHNQQHYKINQDFTFSQNQQYCNTNEDLGFTQNHHYNTNQCFSQLWKDPDFSNSPLQNRNYPLITVSSHFVYKEVTERRHLSPAQYFPAGLHHGPLRQREVNRHGRRLRPYY